MENKVKEVKCKHAEENCMCNGCESCLANAKEYHKKMNHDGSELDC
jgi:hypothetical protein